MTLERAPRWFLLTVSSAAIGLCLIFSGRAIADSDKVRGVAYSALNLSQNNFGLINDLKVQIADVRGAQETFRKEYRQDQKEMDSKLNELLRAVRRS